MGLDVLELPGGDFLLVFNKKMQGKLTWRSRSSREGDFLMVFNNDVVRRLDANTTHLRQCV